MKSKISLMAGVLFLALMTMCLVDCHSGNKHLITLRSCVNDIRLEKPGFKLTQETIYEVEQGRESEFEEKACDVRSLNRTFSSPGTHLDFSAQSGDTVQALRLQPEYFRSPLLALHKISDPSTADSYSAKIWSDTLSGREFCFLILATINYDREEKDRGTMDEYFWIIERCPLRQIFYYKTLAGKFHIREGKPHYAYTFNRTVEVINDRVLITSHTLKSLSGFVVNGDTLVEVETKKIDDKADTILY